MARKRMLSPEIWDSESFGSLSVLGKIIWIGLISQADDEGIGKAKPSYIKAKLFPFNDEMRVVDVEATLAELASKVSVTFYEVEGMQLYSLDNWLSWQKIDKPTKSKLKKPHESGVGVVIQNRELLPEPSPNPYRGIPDLREYKENMNKNKKREYKEEANAILSPIINIVKDFKVDCELAEIDYKLIAEELKQSEFLMNTVKSLSKLNHMADKILIGEYRTFNNAKVGSKLELSKDYNNDELEKMFGDIYK